MTYPLDTTGSIEIAHGTRQGETPEQYAARMEGLHRMRDSVASAGAWKYPPRKKEPSFSAFMLYMCAALMGIIAGAVLFAERVF